MSRPGTAEGPPLPPPFPFHNKDPDDEVQEIVRDLQHSTYLNPIVDKFLQDPTQKDLFHQAFARQANLIKSRIQSFDVGHVTVYDKVLLRLTDNGNRFDSIAAQEYFCEEFLAISKDGNSIEAEKILDQSLVLKALVARGKELPPGTISQKTLNSHFVHQLQTPMENTARNTPPRPAMARKAKKSLKHLIH